MFFLSIRGERYGWNICCLKMSWMYPGDTIKKSGMYSGDTICVVLLVVE